MKHIIALQILLLILSSCKNNSTDEFIELSSIQNEFTLDGLLTESFWEFEKASFKTKKGLENTIVPEFQFLRDDSMLYFGAKFKLDNALDSSINSKGQINLRIDLKSVDSTDRKYRLLFFPGNASDSQMGFDLEACKNFDKIVQGFEYASNFHQGLWTIEFKIPIKDLAMINTDCIKARLKFYNSFLKEEFVSSYYPEDGESIKLKIRD